MDFMLVNGHVSWNMSVKLKDVFRTTIDNSKWRMYVAKLMLNWKDLMVECERTILLPVVTDNHFHKPVSNSTDVCVWCVVCGLETSSWKSIRTQTVILATDLQITWQLVSTHIMQMVSFQDSTICWVVLFWNCSSWTIYGIHLCNTKAFLYSWYKHVLKNNNNRNQQRHHILYAIWFALFTQTLIWKKIKIAKGNR